MFLNKEGDEVEEKMNKTRRYFLFALVIILILGIILIIISSVINPEPHFKITKENLTLEWLDENCELKFSEKNSLKYQCGDFIVDFWMQGK